MMKNFIFTFILFAIILTVNAVLFQLNKRRNFISCPPNYQGFNVTFSPNSFPQKPEVEYNVSGILTHNITKDRTVLGIWYTDSSKSFGLGDTYFQNFTKSYKAKPPFVITASEIAPELPIHFFIQISVADPANEPNKYIIYACTEIDMINL
ncbi:hypothetical protein C2G38_2205154 [Gigaspora rosea]|uniref:MD-2-related lipid-recognition domain-containing protein n=1 Tax=Gigaspora rosea TaxID=44941 RepID=A0A397UKM2_9GLOM|nr:hypothetical protein C2G38_2205154 [Gigaspora rosea]